MAKPGPVGRESVEPLRRQETDLGIAVDRASGRPLPDQLELAIRDLVASGALTGGARLPSSRALADQLSVSRGVVVEAYDRLRRQGVLEVQQGAAPRIGAAPAAAPAPPTPDRASPPPGPRWRLHPALVPPGTFDRRAWRNLIRRALDEATDEELRAVEPVGLPRLRGALTEQLARSRGVVTAPERIAITSGVTHGLSMLAPLIKGRGPVAVEEPGFAIHQGTLAALGCELRPIPTDPDGIDVQALAASDARSILVTPAHDMPRGTPMSAERRTELLRWAAERDGLVLEDDYDGELRYDRRSVRALQGAGPEHVIYLGTTSKVLSPAIRIGWVVAPAALAASLPVLTTFAGGQPSMLEQVALAIAMREGVFDRSVARLRRTAAARRGALAEALAEAVPGAAVEGVPAGLAISLRIPGVAAMDLLRTAAAEGVEVVPVQDGPDVIVPVGVGGVHESAAGEAARALAQAVVAARSAPR
jgi:GntR family transcriptional regulator/MocR family aminotransferase